MLKKWACAGVVATGLLLACFAVAGCARGGSGVSSTAGLSAPGVPNSWVDLKPAGPVPSARFGEALLYLSGPGTVFMFGGATDRTSPLSDTWIYDPQKNRWTDAKPSSEAPPARWAMAAAYDPAANKVVVFGGIGTDDVLLNDTWSYDVAANTWSKLVPASAPSIRCRATMAYEPATDRLLLFGGRNFRGSSSGYFQQDYSDTWAFDLAGDTWTDLAPSGAAPAPSAGSATLIGAGPNGGLQLFAGLQPLPWIPPSIPADKLDKDWSLWTYDAGANAWLADTPPTKSPPASQYFGLVLDTTSDRAVQFGGFGIQYGTLGDIWTYDPRANTWTITPAGGPSAPAPRIDPGMVYDPKTRMVILFGGRNAWGNEWNYAVLPSETWGYTP
jgi:hypothetical protein